MFGSGRKISRRIFLRDGSLALGGMAVGASLIGSAGCRCGVSGEGTEQGDQAQGALPDRWRDYVVRLDLRESYHLADIDHHGLFVDFGNAARFKYTLGNWRCGWGSDVEEQGTTFTWGAESPCRGFFHLDAAGPIKFRFRAKAGDADRLSLYVNDQAISRIDLGEAWSEQEVAVAPEHTLAGENNFKLTFRSSSERSLAIDYLRIITGEAETVAGESFVAPTADHVVRSFAVGAEDRSVLALRSPSRLS